MITTTGYKTLRAMCRASASLLVSGLLLLTPGSASALHINEILFNDPNGTDAPNEYVEIRGEANATIPAGTYLVGIEGDQQQGQGAGDIQTIFDLSGLTLGSKGFLTILMQSSPYSVDAGSASTSGDSGGFNGAAGFDTDGISHIEEPSATFLLIQSTSAPTTAVDIDTGTPDGIPDGATYDSWTVLDSVGICDDSADNGADVESICYGDIIFVQDANNAGVTLTTQPGATIVETGDVDINYVARIGNSTGSAATDWVGAQLDGSAPPTGFTLAAGATFPDTLEGEALNHVGAKNPGDTDQVNCSAVRTPTGKIAVICL